jgi:Uncharacterized conserved protein
MELTPGLRRIPPPDLAAVGQDEDLAQRIRDEIDRGGPITFARFMDLALYDPAGGYYRSAEARPGRGGDFLTAPETHPIFGATLARALDEIWQRLDRPSRFVIREHGAGDGALAASILTGLRVSGSGLAETVRYQPVEVDPRRVEAFVDRLGAIGFGAAVETPGDDPTTGVVLANEVLDALPVHRVVQRGDELLELRVGIRDGGFADVEAAPSTPQLFVQLAAEGITLADGQHAEVCLALDGWVSEAAAGLGQGALLLVDYGYPATELYDPVRRRDGTLRAYLRHRVHDDPYIHVGRQDLTAHVDVDAVQRAAAEAGLVHLGTTTQAEFLVGLGMDELLRTIQSDPATTMEDYLAVRSAVMRLLDPAAMGRFRVMGFGRDWPDGTAAPPLAGFGYRVRWR